MIEHTIEPKGGTDRIAAERDFEYDGVTYQWVGECAYCGQIIESNDPEYQWFHVREDA